MSMNRVSFTMQELVDRTEAELDEAREEVERSEQRLENADGYPKPLHDALESNRSDVKALEKRLQAVEAKRDEWGAEATFTIRELSYNELMKKRDEVASKAGPGRSADGAYNSQMLELAVEDMPDAVDANTPGDLTYSIGSLLFDLVDDYNTTGELVLGN